jgi:hypothetical protein
MSADDDFGSLASRIWHFHGQIGISELQIGKWALTYDAKLRARS